MLKLLSAGYRTESWVALSWIWCMKTEKKSEESNRTRGQLNWFPLESIHSVSIRAAIKCFNTATFTFELFLHGMSGAMLFMKKLILTLFESQRCWIVLGPPFLEGHTMATVQLIHQKENDQKNWQRLEIPQNPDFCWRFDETHHEKIPRFKTSK